MSHWWRSHTVAALAVALALGAPSASPASVENHFVDGDDADSARIRVPARGEGLFVVALGDSVASGEGNPDHGHWRSKRCHRSAVAGVERAIRLLSQTKPARPVTFVNLACSGATVRRGVLGPYPGIDPSAGHGDAPAQVKRLREIVDAAGGRPADAILISVGANDVHFGDVVRRCMAATYCPQSRYGEGTLDGAVREALADLPGRYDALAAALRRGKLVRDDRHVFLTDYFDPTRDAGGTTCRAIAGGVSRRELAWAQDQVLSPLRAAVEAGARRNGWTLVGGITEAFAGHGACAGTERWVRSLREALATGNPSGTLHPNDAGHAAIADSIAAVVGPALGLTPPAGAGEFVAPKEITKYDIPWGVVALLAVVLIVFIVVVATSGGRHRLRWFVSRGEPPRQRQRTQGPRLGRIAPQPRPGYSVAAQLAVRIAGALGGVLLTTGFVAVVGAALIWVRFWAARFPADQAVAAVGRSELLVVGAQAIGLFAGLALIAVVLLWALDGAATNSHRTRATLALLVCAELVAAVLVGGFNGRERLQLIVGFAAMAIALLIVVNALHRVRRRSPKQFPEILLRMPGMWLFNLGPKQTTKKARMRRAGRRLVQTAPLVACAAAVLAASEARGAWTRGIVVGLVVALAALLFLLPAGAARNATNKTNGYLSAARAAVAGTVLVCLLILVGRDELWLAAAAIVAVALAGLSLTVAQGSGDGFVPVAIMVFFTVCAFGAIVTCLRFLDSPTAQPVAFLLKDQTAVCGVWVGESNGRLWYARLPLVERGDVRRPAARNSALTSVERGNLLDMALGPQQDVGRAQAQAAALRRVLTLEHRIERPKNVGGCGPARPRQQQVEHTAERALAKRVQPELILDREDGFWPVSAMTVFTMQDRRAHLCRNVAPRRCVRVATPSDLPFNGGDGEYLNYPAAVAHVDDEKRLFLDAAGSVDPSISQREYFLVTRGKGQNAPYTVQFWFYYTYNYLKTGLFLKAGLHEGDFETIAMLVSAKSHQPRYVWMARHATEGRMFLWDEDRLKKTADGHLIAYAAKGSHANYESCTRQGRPLDAPFGLIDDRPQCDPEHELHLAPEATHLVDLSRVPWGCWRGNFGETTQDDLLGRTPYIIDHGPRSPLWQQKYGGTTSEPCLGVRVSDTREVDTAGQTGEEVLSDRVSARLRSGAATMDAAVDQCGDWEHAPATGVFVLACDQAQLTRYLRNGLEQPASGGLRIDVTGARGVQTGPVTVPAVRRDPGHTSADRWWIGAGHTTTAEIYASCQVASGMLETRFVGVNVSPRRSLRLDTHRPDHNWDLVDEAGRSALARPVTPHLVDGKKDDGPDGRTPAPTCGQGL
jgi:lysophospholipase L1-like esterase